MGSPQASIWWHSYILTVGYISSIVNVFDLDGSLIGSGDGAPSTAVCHLHWNSDEQDLLWIGGYMGLTLVHVELLDSKPPSPVEKFMFTILNTSVDETPSSSVCLTTLIHKKLHETAGCGLYMENNEILSGDLSGNIFKWTIGDTKPKQHTIIPDSVRCFISENLVGTLSGALYNIDTQEIIEDFKTTIICSAWNRSKTSCLIGLGDGSLVNLQTKKIIALHENNAEIWSVCWSPNEELCATASEDQTTCIWKINDDDQRKLIATLTGHTTAVTAVQWKSERIYTCADDRTVRVYNTESNEYNCLYVLHTPKSLFGWFTLTYLKVDEDKKLIICTTQNGYLVIWRDEGNNEIPILCQKIHFGSLEGLAYDKEAHRVVTIGSDCTVTSLRLHLD
jgi:WD40 repeat protein